MINHKNMSDTTTFGGVDETSGEGRGHGAVEFSGGMDGGDAVAGEDEAVSLAEDSARGG